MANTYTLIQTTAVTSGTASNITFSSIPSTYKDLKILMSCRGTNVNNTDLVLEFNGDVYTNNNYTQKYILGYGNGGSASGTQTYGQSGIIHGTSSPNYFDCCEIYVPNYSATSINKVFYTFDVMERNDNVCYTWGAANKWASNSAITSVKLYPLSGSFPTYTTASIYGI